MASQGINHFLVPKHYLLPKEQAAKILEELDLKLEQLPLIHKNDPAIKDFKAARDEIIKIVRNSPTAGQTVYYRRVV